MKMSKKHAVEFFEVLDADKSGGLTVKEFKEFLFSEECRESNCFSSLTLCRVPKTYEKG